MKVALLLGGGLTIIMLLNAVCTRILMRWYGLEESLNTPSKTDVEDLIK